MKLMEKLKNALFEEEYVEVEEKPVKEKKKKEKLFRKDKNKDIEQIKRKGRERAREEFEEEKEEKPIVKKIATPKETPKPVIEEVEETLEDFEEDRNELKGNNDFKFQEILDDDFTYDAPKPQKKLEPKFNNVARKVMDTVKKKEEKPLYSGGKKEETFGFEKEYNSSHAYDSKPTKSTFKPSPIISPIYGVLDKNYQQEEIVPKKEVRMPTFGTEHLDIDEVRNRAYGISQEEDMFDVEEAFDTSEIEEDINADDNNDLLDLTDQVKTPSVSKVTVGDAEEYFQDLGLEYNNDYIDVSKEKATGRRVVENKEITEKVEEENKVMSQSEEPQIDEELEKTKSDDENLFDLIDSMYEKE